MNQTTYSFLTAFLLFGFFLHAEESSVDKKKLPKKDTIVVDFKNFDKKEIWEPKVKEGRPMTKVLKDKDLKVDVLRLKSFEASYYFQKEVNVDISKYKKFSWQWKVRRHPLNGDVRVGSRDDQAIQVLLAFEGRNLISYIWDSNAPVGYSKDSSIPFIVSQKILVVQSGDDKKDLNKWFSFERDINADYKKLYGKNAPKLAGVAIQINSQHTESYCESYLSPLQFIAE